MTRSSGPGTGLSGRLGVRAAVLLLTVIPLVLVSVPFGFTQVTRARAAASTADAVSQARRVGHLLQQLQRQGLLTAAFVADPSAAGADLSQQQAVEAELNNVHSGASPEVAAALERVASLSQLSQTAARRSISLADVAHSYDVAITGLIDALGLVSHTTSDGEGLRQQSAADALLRANEQRALRLITLVAAAVSPGQPFVDSAGQRAVAYAERFGQQAEPGDAAVVEKVESSALVRRIEQFVAAPGAQFAPEVVTTATQLTGQRAAAQDQVLDAIADRTAGWSADASRQAWLLGGAAIVLFGLVLALGVVLGRSMTRPAARAEPDREPARAGGTPLSAPEVTVESGGGPAVAVDRGRDSAASRQAGAQLLAGAARRTQNLVSRQLEVVGELRRTATEPVLIAHLFRLDRTAARLRRTAEDVLVLSGVSDRSRIGGPIELATALRSAAAEIDDEPRVRMTEPAEVLLVAGLGMDLVLLFAELLENAAESSPPESAVEVGTRFLPGGDLEVSVTDQGIGLPAARLAEENRRLAAPEDEPAEQLGLAVVARLAHRHGLSVELCPAAEGPGVTARVTVPQALFTREVDFRHEPAPVGLFEPGHVPDPVPQLLPAPAIAALATPADDGFGWFANPKPAWPEDEPAVPWEEPTRRGGEPALWGAEPAVSGESAWRGGEPALWGAEPAVSGESAWRGGETARRGDEPAWRGIESVLRGDEPARPGAGPVWCAVESAGRGAEPLLRGDEPAQQGAGPVRPQEAESGWSQAEPDSEPSNQPTTEPTGQPGQPAAEPTGQPGQPAAEPTGQPGQPAAEPTGQRSDESTGRPDQPAVGSADPSTSESADQRAAEPAGQPDAEFAASTGTLADLLEESTVDPVDPVPTQRFAPVAPELRDGMARRVPGAQLAPGLRLPQLVRPPSVRRGLRDPAAERATFDAFSDGVAKARQATSLTADQGGA
ncbi:sensor histidine kinase [Amycolatopsis jiangsuensis]|uniref:histidine kinase n=1 Tax=Amycolatopsis jiangsuensis TaxID=1181879 RepID=A0A840J135_9PSEU|nr:ATP-binding protein [Amycolatopsis jiangsuensis]MBB4687643.1 signal transduction histidine kinase [Amycolatopsis jiangsuensis]